MVLYCPCEQQSCLSAGGAQQQESSRYAGELRLREAAADSTLPVHTGAFMNTDAQCEAVLCLSVFSVSSDGIL